MLEPLRPLVAQTIRPSSPEKRRPVTSSAGGWIWSWRTTRNQAPTTGTRREGRRGGTDLIKLVFACSGMDRIQSCFFRVSDKLLYRTTTVCVP
uniref:Uncharacterized protein n=1 Tax=Arundo donax TaxID=35708 RepID=A0A0A9GNR9_ARUDO